MAKSVGKIQKKILLLLLAGVSIGFSSFSPTAYFRTLRKVGVELRKFNNRQIREAINGLYRSKLASYKEHDDGSVEIVLSEKGKSRALVYRLDTMKIVAPARWDKKWRLVTFDIPDSLKKERDIFRSHLKRLGFNQFQKSVFIHPFECSDEIEFLVELHHLRRYVREAVLIFIDNDFDLRRKFNLV